jgi:hypothetical protein
MHLRKIVVPAIFLMMGAWCAAMVHAEAGAPWAAAQGYGEGQWDTPPRELNAIQRQGYLDGIQGAQKDFDNHRQPNVNNREEYRSPHLPPEQREAYRDGFRRGYNTGVAHLMGGPGAYAQPVPPPVVRGDWSTVPSEFNDVQRRGFLDGIRGAQKDFENHRQPDVNNRDEYRHPDDVPGNLRRAYRDGFRRGYARGWAHLSGQPWRY